MRIVVTGGAGFIGSALVRFLIEETEDQVLNIDKLTYAGSRLNVASVAGHARYRFLEADICDTETVGEAVADFSPDAIVHLAAESHVDRSIDGPSDFVRTNLVGTSCLLECVRTASEGGAKIRFLHVSTDEVFGSLGNSGSFDELSPYRPNSPYAASKAGSDHLVRAWHRTYGLDCVVTNCSNNYGPFQFPEKLIPLTILNALRRKQVSIYGTGEQVRDWLFVDDHVRGIYRALCDGRSGSTYNIGARCERTNVEVVHCVLEALARVRAEDVSNYKSLIRHVDDRPGHDTRYAIDPGRIEKELKWKPQVPFEEGIERTVRWFVDNESWCHSVSSDYEGTRLGTRKGGDARSVNA